MFPNGLSVIKYAELDHTNISYINSVIMIHIFCRNIQESHSYKAIIFTITKNTPIRWEASLVGTFFLVFISASKIWPDYSGPVRV